MGIEQDIQQSSFRNEYQKMAINIIFTANWLNEHIGRVLSNEEITHQQYNILRILRGSDKPLSTLQIRARMLDKMSDTSRIVDRLVVKGFVDKNSCAKDKRLVDITLSKKGHQLVDSLDKFNIQIDELLMGVSEKEAATLNQTLDKLRMQLDK
jgi:DNA-binding MarR family transcriptional regulator